jgi:DNA-binding transcriptional LysR family regulator
MINLQGFDLNLLRVFDALVRERSVARAADRLSLTAPAVSNALKRLRVAFDDPLFVRTRHGMEPSELALKLCAPIQDGLYSIRTALTSTVKFDPKSSARQFRLLMNDVGIAAFLPGVVQRLTRAAPGVDLVITERDHADYENALDSGTDDVAVGRVRLSAAFRSELIATSENVAVLCRDHPALRRDSHTRPRLTGAGYTAARHVEVAPRGAVPNRIEGASRASRQRRIMLSVPHATTLGTVLPGTDLIATVPDRCIDFLCADGRLTWVPLPFATRPNLVYLWWHRRKDSDPGHGWLRGLIRDAAAGWSVPMAGTGRRRAG